MKKLLLLIGIGFYLSMQAMQPTSSDVSRRYQMDRDIARQQQYQAYRNLRASQGYINAWQPYPLYEWDRWLWPARSYYDPGFRSGIWRN